MAKKTDYNVVRESIGIKGIDSMIEGGLPSNGVIGLSGPPGVGKSIFTLHFLLEGARKGEKSVYVNLEEPEENVFRMISQFSFSKEFLTFVDKGLIVIKCFTYPEYEKLYGDLFQKIREDSSVKRLSIDSFNCFFGATVSPQLFSLGTTVNTRKIINESFSMLRRNGLTTLLTLEMQIDNNSYLHNIPFLLDGIISLDFLELGTIERRIFIPKMRWTNQYKESKEFSISKDGIKVLE